jgi:hypothetical protein
MINFKHHYELDEAADAGLAAKAKKSGISIETLRKVYRRGVAAWNSGHRPGTTPQQWGMARVNSYITKGKGTYHGADKDLREEEIAEGDTSDLPRVKKDKESNLPQKYVAGLSASTAKARAAHWKEKDKLSDSDPKAYEPAPGDATAKTKPSKHTLKYRAMFGEDMDEEIYEACWKGYKQIGLKKKGERMVPNCVKEEDDLEEATYQGKKVTLNKPMAGDVKKSKVYVDPDGDGKAQKVNFGDKNLSIKKHIPSRKKSYCARSSGQGNLTDKTSANYWSRKAWDC